MRLRLPWSWLIARGLHALRLAADCASGPSAPEAAPDPAAITSVAASDEAISAPTMAWARGECSRSFSTKLSSPGLPLPCDSVGGYNKLEARRFRLPRRPSRPLGLNWRLFAQVAQ